MFAGLINKAKSAASGLVLKYLARASVAGGIGYELAKCCAQEGFDLVGGQP